MGYMLTIDMDIINAIHLRNQAAQAQHTHQLGPSLESDLPPWCPSERSSPVPDDLCPQPPAAAPPFSRPEHLEIALSESDPFSPLPSGPVPISPELSPLQTTFPHRPAPPLGPLPSPFATGSFRRDEADTARIGRGSDAAPQQQQQQQRRRHLELAPLTVPLPADPELLRFRRATFNATPSAAPFSSSSFQRASHCLCRRCNPPSSALSTSSTNNSNNITPSQQQQPWMPSAPIGTFHHHHRHCTCSTAGKYPPGTTTTATAADNLARQQQQQQQQEDLAEDERRRRRLRRPPPPPLPPPPSLLMIPRTMSLDSGARATRDGGAASVGVSGAAGRHHWDVGPWSPPVSMFEFDSDDDDVDEDDDEEQLDSESEAELLSWGA
ncbi:hypothetical protein NEMBOFW57_001535 [Staphylotrichum longicolle]|uniref:Uncharacterized protein n=1 Tax=Staphylotrichum longicolle TaxID=669026 RepID=A0AAD4F1V2_9PEZI|nr:hypothetical protein NEMBOFW57_001535 [Staphylotrichum longicolle]